MKKTLFILFAFIPLLCNAQQFWAKTFGGQSIDEALDIASDASGNLYVTGYFSATVNFGGTQLTASGATDIFLTKLSSQGTLLWAVKAGGPGPDRALSVKADAAGNAYITGSFHGTANFSGTMITANGSEEDVFVAKYDPSGTLLWVRKGGGPDTDIGNAVTVDNFGNVWVTGQFKMTATFDGLSITSMNNPQGLPSIDVFTAKYDASGNILWLKKGSAKQTDRGMGIVTDDAGNGYVAGQFSDTITFDVQHNNTMYNSIFILKYNAAGQEQWFRKIGGGQYNVAYGIAADGSYLYLAGDFSEHMVFFGTPNQYLYGGHNQAIFMTKYDLNGNYILSAADTSENLVHVRDIAIDGNGNSYLTGDFDCIFTQFSNTYGNGTFNSAGFEDIFVAKYNSSGNREWARQFAGRSKDNGYGICVNNNNIYIAGSFKNYINFPNGSNWQYGSPNITAPTYYYCSSPYYGSYLTYTSNGEEDLFVAMPIDLSRETYDYYYRSGSGCIRDFVSCCIDKNSYETSCPPTDTLTGCGPTAIYAHARTCNHAPNTVNGIGPAYHYLWSTGDTNRSITIYTTGNYSVTVTTRDGCFISSDMVYVEIFPLPITPRISDSKGVNHHALYTAPIKFCYPDSVKLTGENAGINSHLWSGPGIPVNYSTDTNVWVHLTGYYTFSVKNSYGCVSSNTVYVEVLYTFNPITPVMVFPQDLNHDDTITICYGDYISVNVYDVANPNNCITSNTYWYINSGYIGSSSNSCTYFYPTNNGWYDIEAVIERINICDTVFDTAMNHIYIIVDPVPVVNLHISGLMQFCPGGSTTLVATGAQHYEWHLGGMISYNDTVTINAPGYFTLDGSSTNSYGCSDYNYLYFSIQFLPAPVASMIPYTGLICPNDSVLIHVTVPGTYEWYGPDGLPFAVTQGVYVNHPGNYYCVVTDPNGCIMASNTVEVVQYTTPFLEASPSQVICPGQSTWINLYTNVGSSVQWQPPLYGSNYTQQVSAPGTYTCNVNSCGILTQASVTITLSQPFAQISVMGNDTICAGDTVYLTGNPGMTDYEWQPGSIHSSTIQVTQSGTYTLITTNADNCQATSAPVSIYVTPNTGPVPVVHDTGVCYGGHVTITAHPAGNYFWFTNPGMFPVFNGNPFVTPAMTADQTFWVELQTGGPCPSQLVPFVVSIYQSSVADISGPDSICKGDTAHLYGTTGMQGYIWSPSGSTNSSIAVTDAGTYSLTVTDMSGCQDDTTFMVIIHDPHFENITISDCTACSGFQASLYPMPNNLTYTWYDSPGSGPIFTGTPFVTPVLTSPQTYYVQVYDGFCYSNFLPIPVSVINCNKILATNVFTPNGDGYNDVFRVEGYDIKKLVCHIYDRWGHIVAMWTDPEGFWDGIIDPFAKPAPEGVYYYEADIEHSFGKHQIIRGFVQLLR